MPHRAYFLHTSGNLERDLDEHTIEAYFRSNDGLLWIDFYSTGQEDAIFLERLKKNLQLLLQLG